MLKGNNRAAQALFKSVSDDETEWLFVVLSGDRWEITRNRITVAIGKGERASLAAGVEKFLSLTRAIVGSVAACDAAVGAQLDRIERGATAVVKVTKSQGRIRPHAPKGSSAYSPSYGIAAP